MADSEPLPNQPPVQEQANISKFDVQLYFKCTEKSIGDSKIATLEIVPEDCLLFTREEELRIAVSDLRYVNITDALCSSGSQCFVVSYCDRYKDDVVKHLFFKTYEPADQLKCLNELRGQMQYKYNSKPEIQMESLDALSTLRTQPGIIDFVGITINVNNEAGEVNGHSGEETMYLVVLDLEGMLLYKDDLMEPSYRLLFWSESSPDSIENVKLVSSRDIQEDGVITLCTQTSSFSLKSTTKFVDQLENMTPKKKHLLKDPSLLIELLPRLRGNNGDRARGRRPVEPPPVDRWQELAQDGRYDRPDVNAGDRTIANRMRAEFKEALDQLEKNEDIQNLWVTMEFDLVELLQSGTVPLSDHRSGGLNADSGEHLERALSDVTDQLKESNLRVALSRLQACRELFSSSSVGEIRALFDDTDTVLMKKLYMKSLCQ